MLRTPSDENEQLSAEQSLRKARALMREALGMIDATRVFTDCDAHLDLAINCLGEAIDEVKAGGTVFKK